MTDLAGLGSTTPTGAPDRGPTLRVGRGFIALYAAAYMGTILLFLAPLLVSLSLKVNALVGIDRAPGSLSLVAGTGALLSMFANPFFGRMSDRTASRWGRRRPWMVIGLGGGSFGILVIALAPSIAVVLVGWCIAQLFFNALLAALVAVLPDQVPVAQRGQVAGILGICLPIASVSGTYVVQLFTGNELAMFLAPCAIGGLLVLLFVATLHDRHQPAADKAPWSLRELASAFYVNPRRNPDFSWAFTSRFMIVLAYAFLTTYQAYYLLEKLGSRESDVPHQIFLGTLAMSSVVVAASLLGGGFSDRTGRRKVFVCTAAVVFGVAMLVIAVATSFGGFLVGMAVGGLGFGVYMAVDLALVADVLPDPATAAQDLGVMNIAGALPSSIAPAIAPLILAVGGGYGVLYAVAGVCAVLGAAAILPVRRVR
ncbi:MAG: major facilitator superfamily 1 [Nocardioidaceae bacterium]|nr:major facilitator superfamily 1 [Nocardioidaceae bacterium]